MAPLVSVLIPCYNVEDWLADTIESVLAQTWRNIELILVNDGSTDNTLIVAKKYEAPNVKILSQENLGQSASETRALQEAQGDFIEYLDADDLLSPDKLERQILLLDESESGYVASGEWARFYKTPEDARFIPEPIWANFSPVDWLVCSWDGGGMMHGAAWLIPRKVADMAGPWNEGLTLINDFDYFSRVLLASKGVKFCQGAKSYYRSGLSSSLSGAKSRSAIESAFRSLEIGTSALLSQENTSRTRHACATSYQRLIHAIYPAEPDLIKQAEMQVRVWGGSQLKPEGGMLFQVLSKAVGWKSAKQFQKLFYPIKYEKLSTFGFIQQTSSR